MFSSLLNKRSTKVLLLVGSIGFTQKKYNQLQAHSNFEKNIKLIFPEFSLKHENCAFGQVVSKTQLEYVIRQCNEIGQSLEVMRDGDLTKYLDSQKEKKGTKDPS